ncbi:hypothetical protein [Carbonactinospora thermoautotrophica]|uniref:hypothetical protein n=1 Tax=Carbonactinospora thermoautotrophica TaxID=1469144 RepID=UPI000A7CA59A|nr:hypothetical protein [Carbonactinospora thermoautotrophica]
MLLSDENGEQTWEVRRTSSGTYTIRQGSSGPFVGYEGDPDGIQPVRLLPDRREWEITDGPRPGTLTVAAPGSDGPLTLGLYPARIYPPMVALSPTFAEDQDLRERRLGVLWRSATGDTAGDV